MTTAAVQPFPESEDLDIEIDGIVTPFREIEVAAEVGGRIAKKEDVFRAGNFVSEGVRLIEIDRKDYELELKRIHQQVDQVDAELLEIEDEAKREVPEVSF